MYSRLAHLMGPGRGVGNLLAKAGHRALHAAVETLAREDGTAGRQGSRSEYTETSTNVSPRIAADSNIKR